MKAGGLHESDSLGERIPGIINIARIAIVLPLLVMQAFAAYTGMAQEGWVFADTAFYSWVLLYAGIILLTLLRPDWQRQSDGLPDAGAVVDISMMMVLVYLAGGTSSGFGILILPFVATSCLLSSGRYPLLYAGYAALLLGLNLFLEGSVRISPPSWDMQNLLGAAALAGACLLVALLTSLAARYLKQASESASRHRQAYRRISGLNRLVLNRVREGIVVIDAGQRVWLFNRQAKTYFPTLAIGQQEFFFNELIDIWQRAPDQDFETDVHIFQHAMHVRAVPLIQDDTQLLMLYVRSQREVAAEAMSTKLTSLGRLTANLAHEIRNPMSAIRHAGSLLQESDDHAADPFKAKLYGIIDSNIGRIDKMLEDVSLLNKRDNIRREPVNLMTFWLDFKQEFTLNNPESLGCLRMNMDGNNLTVSADPAHLRQIVWNLCNNAWRHSRRDRNAVTVLIRPSGSLNVSIVVADNGRGVAPHARSQLFEPFFTTEQHGTGLGLYLARELAHANFGQLHYHPEMNGFELILPKDRHD